MGRGTALSARTRSGRAQIHTPKTTGERAADRVATAMGSWRFIIIQSAIVAAWIALNLVALLRHFDPYPFILLNLLFSTQAAYAAPIIMMSQNRQATKDRQRDDHEAVTVDATADIVALTHANTEEIRRLAREQGRSSPRRIRCWRSRRSCSPCSGGTSPGRRRAAHLARSGSMTFRQSKYAEGRRERERGTARNSNTVTIAQSVALTSTSDTSALVDAFRAGKSPWTIAAYRQELEDSRQFVNAASIGDAARIPRGSGQGTTNMTALQYRNRPHERGMAAGTVTACHSLHRSVSGTFDWITEMLLQPQLS